MMSTPVWSSKLADDDNYHCELLDEDNDNNEEITADRNVWIYNLLVGSWGA